MMIKALRNVQLKHLWNYRLNFIAFISLIWVMPVVLVVTTLAHYSATGQPMRASRIFTFMVLVSIVQQPLQEFASILQGIVQAQVSSGRIEALLRMEDAGTTETVASDGAVVRSLGTDSLSHLSHLALSCSPST
jgi:ABC-type multidrug transport system fused ATPase/permease subunit